MVRKDPDSRPIKFTTVSLSLRATKLAVVLLVGELLGNRFIAAARRNAVQGSSEPRLCIVYVWWRLFIIMLAILETELSISELMMMMIGVLFFCLPFLHRLEKCGRGLRGFLTSDRSQILQICSFPSIGSDQCIRLRFAIQSYVLHSKFYALLRSNKTVSA